MSSACNLRKLRGHNWLLGGVWMLLNILYKTTEDDYQKSAL
jgi:hypothetical protein